MENFGEKLSRGQVMELKICDYIFFFKKKNLWTEKVSGDTHGQVENGGDYEDPKAIILLVIWYEG